MPRSKLAQRKSAHDKGPGFVSRVSTISAEGRRASPATVDETTRSCEFVVTTEAPVLVWDWDRWEEVLEVLRVDGAVVPASGQCPMLDTHMRFSQADQLGSFRNFTAFPEAGSVPASMTGRGYFSTVPAADEAFTKVKEGHLTDVSVGYRVLASVYIEPGATAVVGGRDYTGPLRVVTSWELMEVSICPIGADPAAKARASGTQTTLEDIQMPAKVMNKAAKTKVKANAAKAGKREITPGENAPETEVPTPEDGVTDPPETVAEIVAAQVTEAIAAELPKLVADTVAAALSATPEELEEGEGEDGETPEEARKRGSLAERRRYSEINAMCDKFGIDAQTRSRYLERGVSANAARADIMDRLEARSNGAGFQTASVGTGEMAKVRSAALDGILLRCGARIETPAPGADNFRSMTMREICREFLLRAGQSVPTTALEIVGRALTTTDLPLLLTEGMNRMLMDGWEQAQKTWDIWAATGQANDFRKSMAVGIDFDQELKRVPENGEYTYSYATEYGEEYQLATYGRIFPLTRQALINDDLGAFTRIVPAQGEAASNTINKLAYGVLGRNRAMRNGLPLFSAANRNLIEGGGAPVIATVQAIETAMGLQTDSFGNPLRIFPQFFVAPWALKSASEAFFANEFIGTAEQPLVRNQYFNSYTRVFDPELDRYSASDWYLLGAKGKTVFVFFLNGQQSPTLEERRGWTVDGMEYKVRIDATAAAISALGMAKSTEDPETPTPAFPDDFSPLHTRDTVAQD